MDSDKKPWYKNWWGIILLIIFWPFTIIYLLLKGKINWKVASVIAIVLIFIGISNSRNPTNQINNSSNDLIPTKQLTINKPTDKQKSVEDKLWDAVDKSQHTRKDVTVDYSKDDGSVIMTFFRDNYLDDNHIVKDAYTSFVNFGIEAFKIPEITDVNVQSKVKMINQYGKETINSVVIVQMNKSTFQKFEWNNLRNLASVNVYKIFSENAEIHSIVPGVLKNVDINKLWIK